MISLLSQPIKTENSFLKIYKFTDEDILKKCIDECDSLLHPSLNREVGFFSDTYHGKYMFGNNYHVTTSQKLTSSLSLLLQNINIEFNSDYNGILVNKYENGTKHISRHSDSKNHPENGVMIISFGTTRRFGVYDKLTSKNKIVIPLIHGEMIHMGGKFQEEFEHDVKQDKDVNGVRYSLSFHKYMGLGLY